MSGERRHKACLVGRRATTSPSRHLAGEAEIVLRRRGLTIELDACQDEVIATPLRRQRILMLADIHHRNGNVIDDIRQFPMYSRHNYYLFNPMDAYRFNRNSPKRKLLDILPFSLFDAILIHFSLYSISNAYIAPRISRKIRSFNGIKIQTIRDEYRYIDKFAEKMAFHGIDILFSVLRPEHIEQVYHHACLRDMTRVSTLPGLAPQHMMSQPVPLIRDRKFHVSYRCNSADELSALVGSFGLEKVELGRGFLRRAKERALQTDIQEGNDQRIYGDAWIALHLNSKAVLSAPGGSGLFDFSGAAAEAAEAFKKINPTATTNEIIRGALSDFDGNIVHRQITPRTFEAIALRTALIMPHDEYRGVLKPWRHYIPIEQNYSNFDQIAACLRNDDFLQELVERAYQEILVDGGYTRQDFARKFDTALDVLVPTLVSRGSKGFRP